MTINTSIPFGTTANDFIAIPDTYSRADYRQPQTDNYLLNTSFKFTLARTPNITWFCQKVSIPSLSFGFIEQPTRFGAKLPISGTQYDFDDLTIEFLVDEKVNTWMEIYDWMTSIGNPKDDKDKHLEWDNHTSDATLTILSSSYNPQYNIKFYNMFPTQLGELTFDSAAAETEPIVSQVTFKYRYYEIMQSN